MDNSSAMTGFFIYKIKEKSAPFIFVSIIFSFLIFLKGLGYRELYDISIYTYLVLLLCERRSIRQIVLLLLLLLLHVFIPGISLLWGYCALMFSIDKYTLHYGILCVMLWVCESLRIIPCAPWLIALLVSLFTVLGCLRYEYKRWMIIVFSILAILLTIYSMPWWHSKMYAEKYVKSVYSPSEVFCKITNTTYIDSLRLDNRTKIIRSKPFYTKIPNSQPGILIFEINYEGEDENVDPSVWQQPISWHDNQLIGDQYYLEAIRHDGGLYSNKGITLKDDKGTVQLAYIESLATVRPLIMQHDDVLYLHDSDYSSSFLANYQKCLLNELVGNSDRPNYVRIINIIFAIMTCLMCSSKLMKVQRWEIFVLPLIFALLYQVYFKSIKGDIRLEGDITNSHENNKFDGVVKKVIFAGYDYTIGDDDTKMLVVQKGKETSVKTEKVVVAEEGCIINVNGKSYMVNNNPIGNVNGVVDARQWINDGNIYNGIVKINDVILIATGSPALQQWKNILK